MSQGRDERVEEVLRVRAIPEGFVTTYGDLCPAAPRSVPVLREHHRPGAVAASLARTARSPRASERRLLEHEGVPFSRRAGGHAGGLSAPGGAGSVRVHDQHVAVRRVRDLVGHAAQHPARPRACPGCRPRSGRPAGAPPRQEDSDTAPVGVCWVTWMSSRRAARGSARARRRPGSPRRFRGSDWRPITGAAVPSSTLTTCSCAPLMRASSSARARELSGLDQLVPTTILEHRSAGLDDQHVAGVVGDLVRNAPEQPPLPPHAHAPEHDQVRPPRASRPRRCRRPGLPWGRGHRCRSLAAEPGHRALETPSTCESELSAHSSASGRVAASHAQVRRCPGAPTCTRAGEPRELGGALHARSAVSEPSVPTTIVLNMRVLRRVRVEATVTRRRGGGKVAGPVVELGRVPYARSGSRSVTTGSRRSRSTSRRPATPSRTSCSPTSPRRSRPLATTSASAAWCSPPRTRRSSPRAGASTSSRGTWRPCTSTSGPSASPPVRDDPAAGQAHDLRRQRARLRRRARARARLADLIVAKEGASFGTPGDQRRGVPVHDHGADLPQRPAQEGERAAAAGRADLGGGGARGGDREPRGAGRRVRGGRRGVGAEAGRQVAQC